MKNFVKFSICLFAFVSIAFTPQPETSNKETVVVIDVSHGGDDFGVQLGTYSEKELVLHIANQIDLLNTNTNLKIHFTRSSDFNATLKQRVEFINDLQPDLVLSLHINENKDENASGAELYISEASKAFVQAEAIAKSLQLQLKTTPINKVHIKKANYFILKNSEAPTVLLQLGYLTNDTDRKLLVDPSVQDHIAKSILGFLSEL